ncbi:MAG TPA: hypothetical protein VH879_09125 [Gemmatimonadales bacterium]|jgi:hypothetical protein
MSDENPRMSGKEIGRWVILAALIVACLAAYFLYSPRVPTVIRPAPAPALP